MFGKRLALGFVAVCLGLAALGIMVLIGCGTLANLKAPTADPPGNFLHEESAVKPYGGDVYDANEGLKAAREGGLLWVFAPYVLFVEMPLSFVGDTLTLPYVLYRLTRPDPPFVPPTDKPSKEGAAKPADEKAAVGETLTAPYIIDRPTGPDQPFVPPTDKQPDLKASPTGPEGR